MIFLLWKDINYTTKSVMLYHLAVYLSKLHYAALLLSVSIIIAAVLPATPTLLLSTLTICHTAVVFTFICMQILQKLQYSTVPLNCLVACV